MIPGPLHDDRYRMVEDEFLSTAHLFTAHIHRAEYNRLKALATSQNAAAISEIERPVVGSPGTLARRRREASRRTRKQNELRGREASSPPPPPPPRRTSSGLQGLMESPRKERRLARALLLPRAASTTKAAAGFGSRARGPDVRDVSLRGSRLSEKRRVSAPVTRVCADDDDDDEDGDDLSRSAVRDGSAMKQKPLAMAKPMVVTPPPQPEFPERHDDDDDDDDDDPFGIQKRRVRREKSREQLRETKKTKLKPTGSQDVIPTFL